MVCVRLSKNIDARRRFSQLLVERIESFDDAYWSVSKQSQGGIFNIQLKPNMNAFYKGITDKSYSTIELLTQPHIGIWYSVDSFVQNSRLQLAVRMPFSESNLVQFGRYYRQEFGKSFSGLDVYYRNL
jgi:hypothetical protein